MAELFNTPVGFRAETVDENWNVTVDDQGNLLLRSNSPTDGVTRLVINDDSGAVGIGTADPQVPLDVAGDVHLRDSASRNRVRLSPSGQRLEVMNEEGEIIGMLGGASDVRLGSNGQRGDLYLYPTSADDIFDNGDARVHLNGQVGEVSLRDAEGTQRVRLSSSAQRIEVMNSEGEIIGMLGGGSNVRLGTHGQRGDLYLYPTSANNIFDNADARVHLNGQAGEVSLRDAEGTQRVRLSSSGQRIEVMNSEGEIIGMLGGGSNVRLGTNGQRGDLYLYPTSADNIFDNGDARVHLNGQAGEVSLRDAEGTQRVRLSSSGQRIEVMNSEGEIIGMLGGAGNIRAGTNGESGDIYLYPSTAGNIFSNGEASIHLNGQTGDIILQNADCAEEFDLADDDLVEPGDVAALGAEGKLLPARTAYSKRVAGVMAGAGSYRPGIIMDRQVSEGRRAPLALLGKVFCKVDATYGAIEIGDLLTSSENPGHAMKASDPARAFGAVIGKALEPFTEGTGLIRVLVTLQ